MKEKDGIYWCTYIMYLINNSPYQRTQWLRYKIDVLFLFVKVSLTPAGPWEVHGVMVCVSQQEEGLNFSLPPSVFICIYC